MGYMYASLKRIGVTSRQTGGLGTCHGFNNHLPEDGSSPVHTNTQPILMIGGFRDGPGGGDRSNLNKPQLSIPTNEVNIARPV